MIALFSAFEYSAIAMAHSDDAKIDGKVEFSHFSSSSWENKPFMAFQ